MKKGGIRILDGKNDVLDVTLSDILEEISNGDQLYWSILFVDGILSSKQKKSLHEYENPINKSDSGLQITWEDLLAFSSKFFQMYEIVLLGCKNLESLKRYTNESKMLMACDIVIELIDCAFWEVYTTDLTLIQKLKEKFQIVEDLEL